MREPETDVERDDVRRQIVGCTRCPRLVAWREQVASPPPPRFAGQSYWSRPVPGFGDPDATVCVLGLATAAHGGNRTGRAFTGNPTADWLMPALYRAGAASRPESVSADDGLYLRGVWMASVVRCPPPGNRPRPEERDRCLPHLASELALLPRLRVVLALGAFAWAAAARLLDVRPRPVFGHGARARATDRVTLLGSYHPSRQNTATGVLTQSMLDAVITAAITLGQEPPGP